MSFLIHKFQYRNYADNINLLLVFLIRISATLTGIGISRFAFSALMPELIMQQWFTASQVAYLSSTNLFGYLVGGIFCLNNKLLPSNFTTLLYASLIVYFSYMACVDSQNFFFFLFWRFLAGMSGVQLMILAPPIITNHLPESKKKIASPIIFSGVGIGILLSAVIIPALAKVNLHLAILVTGVIALFPVVFILLMRLNLRCITSSYRATIPQNNIATQSKFQFNGTVYLIFIAYFTDAICFIPHTIFWVDYLSRYLNFNSQFITWQWGILGFGAILGPYLVIQMAKKLSWTKIIKTILSIKGLAISIPYFTSDLISITISSFVVGSLITGVVATTSSLLREYDADNIRKSWALATLGFSLFQALSGYLFSYLYVNIGDPKNIFIFAAIGLITVAMLLILFMREEKKTALFSRYGHTTGNAIKKP